MSCRKVKILKVSKQEKKTFLLKQTKKERKTNKFKS